MNREEIITFLNTKTINPDLAVEMALEYAKSRGTEDNKISELAKLLTSSPQLLSQTLSNSIDYYLRKFEINSVINNDIPIYYY